MIHAANILKSREFWRSQKPPLGAQIDWGHLLANGLKLCAIGPTELVQQSPHTSKSESAVVAPDYYPSSSSNNIVIGSRQLYLTSQHSLAARLFPGSTTFGFIASFHTGATTSNRWTFLNHSSGRVYFNFTNNSSTSNNTYADPQLPTVSSNAYSSHLITYNGSNHPHYVNGNIGSNNSTTNEGMTDVGSQSVTIGAIPGENGFTGKLAYLYFWNRVLTAHEALELHNNPYQFLYVPTPRTRFVAAGGGTPLTLDISDSVTLSDDRAFSVGIGKSDSFTIDDARSNDCSVPKSDSFSVSDSRSNDFGSAITDAFTANDNTSRSYGVAKSDSVSFSDSIETLIGLIISVIDTITASDSEVLDFSKGIIDTVAISDLVAKETSKALADSFTVSDSAINALNGILTEWIINLLSQSRNGVAQSTAFTVTRTTSTFAVTNTP